MNILLVNHYAGSVYHGMEFRPYYLGLEWVKAGHNVTIVAADCSHLRSKKVKLTDSLETENIDGINYVWLKTLDYSGNGVRRALNILSFVAGLFRFSKRIISIAKPDVVIASSTYPADIFPCRYIANKTNAKLVFEIHDLWPLSPMELGNMSKYHPFIMAMQYAENYAYKYCHKVISILPNTLEHCVEHGLDKNKWHCIQNGFNKESLENNTTDILNENILKTIRKHKADGKFLIGYAGGFNLSNGLDVFIDSMAELDPDKYHVFMVGKGQEKEKLKILSKNKNAPIDFFDEISKNSVISFLSRMDVLYGGGKNHPLYRFGISPNKLVDYLLSGVMTIQPINAPNNVITLSGAGVTLDEISKITILDAVHKLSKMPLKERKNLGSIGNKYAIDNLSYDKLASLFIFFIQGDIQ